MHVLEGLWLTFTEFDYGLGPSLLDASELSAMASREASQRSSVQLLHGHGQHVYVYTAIITRSYTLLLIRIYL